MTKAIVVAAIMTTTAVSGGATQTGPQTINDFPRFQALELGKTTKQQVYEAFGQPQDVISSEQTGQTFWRYFQVTTRINTSSLIPYVGPHALGFRSRDPVADSRLGRSPFPGQPAAPSDGIFVGAADPSTSHPASTAAPHDTSPVTDVPRWSPQRACAHIGRR